MPRPKSEITKGAKMLGVRLTPSQHEEFKRLGGSAWFRKMLAQSIQSRREASQISDERYYA